MSRARKFVFQSESYDPPSNKTIFGSRKASQFLLDAFNRVDSVDIITIGDSNAGSAGNCGYQFGLATACAANGLVNYATPLYSCAGKDGANTRTGGMFLPLNNVRWSGVDGNLSTLFTAIGSGNTTANALRSYLGINVNSWETNSWIEPYGFRWDAAFVPNGSTYTSTGNGTCIRVLRPSLMTEGVYGNGVVPLQYRVVNATFPASQGVGQFKLACMTNVNTIESANSSFYGTDTGFTVYGYQTSTLDFNSPVVNDRDTDVPTAFHCSYDGYNNGSNYRITGPFCAFWHSIIELNRKGFCVSNLLYKGGATDANIFTRMNGLGVLLPMYLSELRNRQIAAGGTGRVVLWCNCGVNGPSTTTSWTSNMQQIVDLVRTKWIDFNGFPENDLAFVFSVTHPQDYENTGVEVSLGPVRVAANNWAAQNILNNVCVVDISKMLSYSDILYRRLYQTYGNSVEKAHLWESENHVSDVAANSDRYGYGTYEDYSYDIQILNNGYSVMSNLIVKNLLLYA